MGNKINKPRFANEEHLQEPPRYEQIQEQMLKDSPHNCIGMIRLNADGIARTAIATGILISKTEVLTSAHILFYNHGLCLKMKKPI
jgi:hypothetical protein